MAVLKKFPPWGKLFCCGRMAAARAELYSGKAQQPESCLHGGLGSGLKLKLVQTLVLTVDHPSISS